MGLSSLLGGSPTAAQLGSRTTAATAVSGATTAERARQEEDSDSSSAPKAAQFYSAFNSDDGSPHSGKRELDLLFHMLPGAPEIVAIGETLCEYVLIVSAPQLCPMPGFFEGSFFDSESLRSSTSSGSESGAATGSAAKKNKLHNNPEL